VQPFILISVSPYTAREYATLDYAAIPVVRLLSGEPDRAGGPGRLPSEPEPATAAGTRAASMG
jgi:hypothetical protein